MAKLDPNNLFSDFPKELATWLMGHAEKVLMTVTSIVPTVKGGESEEKAVAVSRSLFYILAFGDALFATSEQHAELRKAMRGVLDKFKEGGADHTAAGNRVREVLTDLEDAEEEEE